MLTSPCLCYDTLLPHPQTEQCLSQRIIYFVCPCMVQVFPLEIYFWSLSIGPACTSSHKQVYKQERSILLDTMSARNGLPEYHCKDINILQYIMELWWKRRLHLDLWICLKVTNTWNTLNVSDRYSSPSCNTMNVSDAYTSPSRPVVSYIFRSQRHIDSFHIV